MVIPRFVQQALNDRPITVYGDGLQTRTFTHVTDAVTALLSLAGNPEADGEVVNIGGQEEISILGLAHRIKEKTGSRSEVQLIPYEDAFPRDFEDMQRRVPSTLKLQKLVGYHPTKVLDDILDDVVAHYRHNAQRTECQNV